MIHVELKTLDQHSDVHYLFYTFEEDWKAIEFLDASKQAEKMVHEKNLSKLYSIIYMKRKIYTANIPGLMQTVTKMSKNTINDKIEYTYVIGGMERVIYTTKLFMDVFRVKIPYSFCDSVELALEDIAKRSQQSSIG